VNSPLIATETQDGILRLVLSDPATRNTLSERMMAALQQALDGAARDDRTRIIVIAAEGPVFSAGHNLKEMSARRQDADRGMAYFAQVFKTCATLMQSITGHPKPVIAEVQGLASAAGCQLVASCDLAVASEAASFCTPGVNIGLFCSTPMVALSRNVSRKHAMEMLLTGDTISAVEAHRFGLVNRLVPADQLAPECARIALKIAAKSRATLKIGKQAFYRQAELPLAEAYDYASRVMVENMLARDAEEGISAFIAKRQPVWEDR
jgi:enoyl-CoA hydratase/carnithine racemase